MPTNAVFGGRDTVLGGGDSWFFSLQFSISILLPAALLSCKGPGSVSLAPFTSFLQQPNNKNGRNKDTSQIQLPILKPHRGNASPPEAWFSFALSRNTKLRPLRYFQNHVQTAVYENVNVLWYSYMKKKSMKIYTLLRETYQKQYSGFRSAPWLSKRYSWTSSLRSPSHKKS